METKFQTSFIPKKPIVPVGGAVSNFASRQRSHATVSIFFSIGLLMFIVSLGMAGGVYAWKSVTLSNQNNLKQQLENRKKQFNTSLIEDLKRVNVKIDVAEKLMEKHLALSNIFAIISRLTAERVRFSSMELTAPNTKSNDINISMSGVGSDLSAVAFQSDVLGELDRYGLRKIVKNPILSDPTLDAGGMVSFGFSASIDPSTLSYMNSIANNAATSSLPAEDFQ